MTYVLGFLAQVFDPFLKTESQGNTKSRLTELGRTKWPLFLRFSHVPRVFLGTFEYF